MKLSICIACFNSLEATKAQWGFLTATTGGRHTDDVELIVLDNGSTDGTGEWLRHFVFPFWQQGQYYRVEDNLGVIPSLNRLWRESHGEVIAFLHNDVFVLEDNWDWRVWQAFQADPKVGLAGFFGARGIGDNGGRIECWSNMVDYQHHSGHCAGERQVAVFDGFSLVARREMLEQVGGFDEDYSYHHFYDRDISCASMAAGWKNLLIGVRCQHASGQTACQPHYQEWVSKKLGVPVGSGDQESYNRSERRFFEKWRSRLPWVV